jgi:hypothetical protein
MTTASYTRSQSFTSAQVRAKNPTLSPTKSASITTTMVIPSTPSL